jgi:acyl carrier protein
MASEADVAAAIKDIIAERLDKSADEVVEKAGFMEDLGADSLDLTELLMALEEEFNIEIDDDANQIETVGDAIKYIQSKL